MTTYISAPPGPVRLALAGAFVALLTVGLPGCSGASWSGEVDLTSQDAASAGPASTYLATNPYFRKLVAPVFEHGKGRALGRGLLCDEDALALIRGELAKVHIALTDENVVVYHGPPRDPEGAVHRRKRWSRGEGPWIIDAVDPDRRIAVEYISTADCAYLDDNRRLNGDAAARERFRATIEHIEAAYTADRTGPSDGRCEEPEPVPVGACRYRVMDGELDFRGVAHWVRRQFVREDVDPYVYAVFYDPGVAGKEDDIRAQVRDFIVWLKLNHVL